MRGSPANTYYDRRDEAGKWFGVAVLLLVACIAFGLVLDPPSGEEGGRPDGCSNIMELGMDTATGC